VPVFSGEPIPLPVPLLHASLLQLCGALASGGAGEAAEHIQSAIESGSMDAGSLLTASLARDQTAIRTGAVHRGLAPDLVWLVAELAVSPFAHALQRTLFAGPGEGRVPPTADNAITSLGAGTATRVGASLTLVDANQDKLAAARPALFILAGRGAGPPMRASLRRGRASVRHRRSRRRERKDRRIELCSSCAGYLKTVDVAALSPFPCSPSPIWKRWISTWWQWSAHASAAPRCRDAQGGADSSRSRP
jgi:hypothetical protein